MLSKIWAVLKFLMSLKALWEYFQRAKDAKRSVEAERKAQERDKAIEDLEKAQTDEEIFDAQSRIVRNKP